jgi:hypothetical protein
MPRHIKALMALTVANLAALWVVSLATDWRDVTILLGGAALGFGISLFVLGLMAWNRRRIVC